jgi:anti-repressor protein
VPVFGGDICSALEITAVGRALARLDDGDKLALRRSEAVGSTDTIWQQFDRRVHTITLSTENGATDLVLDSRKPSAGPPLVE